VLANAHGLSCATGDRSGCSGRCEDRAGFYLGRVWDRCPVAELNDDRRILYVLNLEAQSKLSPIAGWPDEYAGWVPTYWGRLVRARADRERHNGGR